MRPGRPFDGATPGVESSVAYRAGRQRPARDFPETAAHADRLQGAAQAPRAPESPPVSAASAARPQAARRTSGKEDA